MNIAYYVTAHGYGHATRSAAVLQALAESGTAVTVQVRTAVTPWMFEASAGNSTRVVSAEIDSGIVDRDFYTQDVETTVARCLSVCARADRIVAAEAAAIRRFGCDVIVGDIPYLIGPIGREVGVPTVAVGNFSWDYIYAAYRDARLEAALLQIKHWYGMVDVMLRLPLGHEMTAFSEVRDVPLLCRRPTRSRAHVREALGVASSPAPLVFVALRYPPSLDSGVAGLAERGYDVVTYDTCQVPRTGRVLVLGQEWQSGFVDVLGASDVAISKLGYSTAAECIGTRVPLVFPARGHHVEHDLLKTGIDKLLPNVEMTFDDAVGGTWWPYVQKVLDRRREAVPVDTAGDAAVARAILEIGAGRREQ